MLFAQMIILATLAVMLVAADLIDHGAFTDRSDEWEPEWRWYRADREPDPEHGGARGYWVTRHAL